MGFVVRRHLPTVGGYALLVALLATSAATFMPVMVAGGSMHPVLTPGDLAVVRRGASVRTGDIALLVHRGHGPVLHRVVGGNASTGYVTQGDANPTPDAHRVHPGDIGGGVVAVLPVGKLLERWRGDSNRATLSTQSNTARR